MSLKFQDTKVPWPFRSGERKGQGAKAPGSDLARVLLADLLQGANWPGSEKAVNRWEEGCNGCRCSLMVRNKNVLGLI